MIKNTLLGCALAAALSTASAMAADFHALAGLQGTTLTPLEDEVLAATEGGTVCAVTIGVITQTADTGIAGGTCFIGLLANLQGPVAIFAFATTFPSFSANLLQLVP